MITLKIEHRISSYEGWRKAFDNDPIDRKRSGVQRYRIYRPTDNPNFVIIDLDFETLEQAQATKMALQKIFPKIEGSLVFDVQLKLLDLIEDKEM